MTVKIASYNLWDHPAGLPHRKTQILDTLTACDADILCLQENFFGDAIRMHFPRLPHCMYDAETGLSVLSRYPVTECRRLPHALAVTLACGIGSLCAVNLHLPWQSAAARETAIIEITDAAAAAHADHTVLAGDFNCSDTSFVQRFLCGEQSLHGHDAYYFDLAEAYAALTGTEAAPTLDFRRNPRWSAVDLPNTLERNQRFDRILLENPYPQSAPQLTEAGIFGEDISPETGLAPSDHYGVYACLSF